MNWIFAHFIPNYFYSCPHAILSLLAARLILCKGKSNHVIWSSQITYCPLESAGAFKILMLRPYPEPTKPEHLGVAVGYHYFLKSPRSTNGQATTGPK